MSKPRTSRIMRRLLVVCVLVVGAGGYAFWAKPWETKPVNVAVETVAPTELRDVLAVNGQIVPKSQVNIAAPIAGQLAEVSVAEGDVVKKGQLLARLDDAIARTTASQATAALQSARVGLEEAQANWQRAEALGKSISAQSREAARFAVETARANVAQLTAAEMQAKQKLAQYEINAPMAGTVLSVSADPGQVVSTSSTLFSIGDLSEPRIETSVDETYGDRLHTGLPARITLVGGDTPMPATISFLAPTVDPDTGGRTVKLAFDTPPKQALPSGLSVSINIVVAKHENAIGIPRAAVLDSGTSPHVFVVKDGKAVRRTVGFANWPSDRVRITDGLKAGDKVITDPGKVSDGSPVSIRPAS